MNPASINWNEPNAYFQPWNLSQEEIRAWITALRSGLYNQAREQLMKRGAYCAMGLFGAIRGELDAGAYRTNRISLHNHPKIQEAGELPYTVDVTVDGTIETCVCVSQLNDSGLGFIEIAKVIEDMIVHLTK